MAVADRYRQPRSIVLGRPWPAPGEPLWLPDDLEWAIAYEQHREATCGRCGTRREEWPTKPTQDLPYVGVTERCPGCQEVALTEESIPEAERSRGAYAVLVPAATVELSDTFRDAALRLGMPEPD